MELYVYENYRDVFPDIDGRNLTDALIELSLDAYGARGHRLLRTERGKPYVELCGGGQLCVSVSHSGTYFLCLIDEEPVGVDVQQERSVAAGRIGRRYFTEAERRLLDEYGDDGFFLLWTRKEAYAKYTGAGLEEIMRGTDVLGRSDVDFLDFQLEKGMYCSCCMMR